jgi:glycosyltransferase involved in cell wall biosynthesis
VTEPLRVLLLNERCHRNPLAGGAETHLFEIFGRLSDAIDVELLCCGFAGAPPTDVFRGVRIRRLGTRLSFYALLPRVVRRHIAQVSVDLVVEAHNKVPFLTPLYAGRVPVLVIHHHLHGLTAFRQVNPAVAAASVLLERLIPHVYRGVREESIDVVPCGVDHDIHRPNAVEGRAPLVLSLGRLEPYKRLDLLLHAMRRVVTEMPQARLVIIGRGQQEHRLRALTDQLGLSGAVRFAGYVSDREKVSLLQRAALLVQCSRKEGWGLTVFEAYACGTPVVASHVPGLSDSVQDGITGRLVHGARPAAFAAAITRVARAYRADAGRFVQRDPIHSANKYEYVNSRPTYATDPTGLTSAVAPNDIVNQTNQAIGGGPDTVGILDVPTMQPPTVGTGPTLPPMCALLSFKIGGMVSCTSGQSCSCSFVLHTLVQVDAPAFWSCKVGFIGTSSYESTSATCGRKTCACRLAAVKCTGKAGCSGREIVAKFLLSACIGGEPLQMHAWIFKNPHDSKVPFDYSRGNCSEQ